MKCLQQEKSQARVHILALLVEQQSFSMITETHCHRVLNAMKLNIDPNHLQPMWLLFFINFLLLLIRIKDNRPPNGMEPLPTGSLQFIHGIIITRELWPVFSLCSRIIRKIFSKCDFSEFSK